MAAKPPRPVLDRQPGRSLESAATVATSRAAAGPVGVSFADHDTEMFDIDAIPFTTREARTVGEMLVEVDRQARSLLLDIEGDHAGSLIRSWPELVNAAGGLWAALPTAGTTPRHQVLPMERLVAHAASVGNSLTLGWPGPGAPDARVALMAETLQGAAWLVRRYGAQIPTQSPLVRRDIQAARSMTMHSLHLVAHAGVVALNAHGRDRYWDAKGAGERISLSQLHPPYVIAPTGNWYDRFAAAETIALKYLATRHAADASDTGSPPSVDHHRVARALAGWDIQAHRTLVGRSCAADHAIIARTQSLIADVGALLVSATRFGGSTPDGVGSGSDDRLASALSESSAAWSNLASRWGDLRGPSDRPDPRLERAAAELHAAYREITHNATTPLPQAAIGRHPALDHALSANLGAIETSVELTDLFVEKSKQPGLVGPARTLSRRAHNEVEAGLVIPDLGGDTVWVSPSDILLKRIVPLPAPVEQSLRDSAARARNAATHGSAAAGHWSEPCGSHAGLGDEEEKDAELSTVRRRLQEAQPTPHHAAFASERTPQR